MEDFARRHDDALVASLQLPPTRCPSDSMFRRVMMGIDFTDESLCVQQQIQLTTEQATPLSIDITTERRSDRVTTRTVSIFDDLTGINSEWVGLARLVKVERLGTRARIMSSCSGATILNLG